MSTGNLRAVLWVLVMLLLGLSVAGKAASLEDMMADDSGAGAQESSGAKSQGSGLSLEGLVNGAQTPSPSAGSGSLLDGVEQERLGRKMQAATTEFEKYQTGIAKRCECVWRNNCPQRWNPGNSGGDAAYQRSESTAIKNMKRVCEQAGSEGRSHWTLDTARARAAQAKNQLASLKKIEGDVSYEALLAQDRAVARLEKERSAKARAEWERAERARRAEDEAWLERTWGSASSVASSDQEFWNDIQSIQDNTMADIHKNQRAHQERKAADKRARADRRAAQPQASASSRMNTIVQACARNGGRYNHRTERCDALSRSPGKNRSRAKSSGNHDAEKQNCLNAGKKWTGSSCDYSSSVVVQGWKNGNTALVQRSAPSRAGTLSSPGARGRFDASAEKSDPGGPNRPGGSLEDLVNPSSTAGGSGTTASPHSGSNQTNTGGAAGSPNRGGSGSGSKNDKYGPRLIPVFVQIESENSWPTQEQACWHAKEVAITAAKNNCRREHGGEPANKKEIGIPIDANCQSYRQIEKSTMWAKEGEWKATGNVILQCRLSK